MAWEDLLRRVELDVADGRPWKARDRLGGALANEPHDAALLDRLGDVSFAMGDLPAAGRAWLLAGRDDDRARAALAAFEERAPAPGERLRILGARAPLDRYPPLAQARIEALREQAGEAGRGWRPRPAARRAPAGSDPEPGRGGSFDAVVVVGLLLVTVGIWLVGAGFLVSWLLRAIL